MRHMNQRREEPSNVTWELIKNACKLEAVETKGDKMGVKSSSSVQMELTSQVLEAALPITISPENPQKEPPQDIARPSKVLLIDQVNYPL